MRSPGETEVFNRHALFTARAFRGLTGTELAVATKISRRSITAFEGGGARPSALAIEVLATALCFPPDFFRAQVSLPEPSALHFRSKRSQVTKRSIDRARSTAALFARCIAAFERFAQFDQGPLPFHTGSSLDAIEAAAQSSRRFLGFGDDAPIANLTRAVEQSGIFVGVFEDAPGVDAFCWHAPRPLILVSAETPYCRRRFTLAHELAHLVLHKGEATGDAARENEAHRFAGALLAPRASFSREFPRPYKRFDWTALFEMKRRWGLSVAAILHRAYDLGLVSPIAYRAAFIHMSNKGWRVTEPHEPGLPEPPTVAGEFLEDLAARGTDVRLVAEAARLDVGLVERLLGVTFPEEESRVLARVPG